MILIKQLFKYFHFRSLGPEDQPPQNVVEMNWWENGFAEYVGWIQQTQYQKTSIPQKMNGLKK